MEAEECKKESPKLCSFFMENKKRPCRFEAYKDSAFCHHHLNSNEFVACPIDPNHSVLKSKLDRHVKVCPKIKYKQDLEKEEWFIESLNTEANRREAADIETEQEQGPEAGKKLKDLQLEPNAAFLDFVKGLDVIFERALAAYTNSFTASPEEKVELASAIIKNLHSSIVYDTLDTDTEKDNFQCQALADLMKSLGLLRPDGVYIEFGAGKGKLTHFVCTANQARGGYILLERELRRHKFDKNYRDHKYFKRFRTDINHFDVRKIPTIFPGMLEETKTSKYELIGISKHMCGGATDLSIKSMMNTSEQVSFSGLCIATCCHHRCDSITYLNLDFLKSLGVSEEGFNWLYAISSWALTKINNKKYQKKNLSVAVEEETSSSNDSELTSERKTLLGFKAKRILDLGRCLFLRAKGLDARLVKYCEVQASPENVVIVVV